MVIDKGFNEVVAELTVQKNVAMETRRRTETEERHLQRLQRFAKLTEILAEIDCGFGYKQFRQLIKIDAEKTNRMVAGRVFCSAIKAIPSNIFFFGPLWFLPALFAADAGVAPGTLTYMAVTTAAVIGALLSFWNIVYVSEGLMTLDLTPSFNDNSVNISKDFPSFRRWQYLCERLFLGCEEAERALTESLVTISQ